MKLIRVKCHNVGICLLFIFLLTAVGTPAQSDEKKLYFPTDAKEIEEFFLKNKPKEPGKKSLQPKGIRGSQTKGLSRVVEDDSSIEAPTVGALILFDYDSALIKPDSYEILREFATALKGQLQDVNMTIAGHTDSRGSDGYNRQLSKRRALAVKDFLVSHHAIDAERLEIRPYGESQPLESNNTDTGRALNRRVEFSGSWE